MSFRSRAAFGGAFLALAIAPAAEAAKKPASFKVRSLAVSDASVAPGDAVRVTGKVRNTKGRKASSARVVYSLRTSRSAKSGNRLDSEGVERTKGGKSRSFSARVDIPSSTGPGTYFLTVCVNRSGVKKAKCSRTELTVALPPTPAPPTPPAPPAPPAPPEPDTRSVSKKLRTAITTEGMGKHLEALQAIATDNGGNRASGFQGYGASVQYVLQTLRGAGYNATSQVFDFVTFAENTDPVLEQTAPTPRTFGEDEFLTMSYSASGDATGALDAIDVKIAGNEADSTSGCEDADFAGFTDGDIALMQRGTCPFVDKVVNAQEAGAAGAVVFNQGNDPGRVGVVAGTLGEPAQDGVDPDVEIPATGISYALGKELAQTAGAAVHMVVDATSDQRKSTNVIADTPTGSADDVVLVGSHLDSVPEGPGINDNGSGSAYNLELAVQMAKLGITPENKVRFAFWGAEESGLVGSTRYVEAATEESFAQLAAELNFDMLASPNHATFVYDGDFSNTPSPPPHRASTPAPRRSSRTSRSGSRVPGSMPSRRRSTGAPTTRRSRTSACPPVACSPAPRSRRTSPRPRSGAARPARRSTPTTTRPGTTSTTSTWPATRSCPTPRRTCWRSWPATRTCGPRSRRAGRRSASRAAPRPSPSGRSTSARASRASRCNDEATRQGRPPGRPSCVTGARPGSFLTGRRPAEPARPDGPGLLPARRVRARGAQPRARPARRRAGT